MLTSWRNNLNIGDTSMYISRGVGKNGLAYKELIVGFKTIFINTYCTTVLDLGDEVTDGRQILLKHEAF
jgi:hypothetical protein